MEKILPKSTKNQTKLILKRNNTHTEKNTDRLKSKRKTDRQINVASGLYELYMFRVWVPTNNSRS